MQILSSIHLNITLSLKNYFKIAIKILEKTSKNYITKGEYISCNIFIIVNNHFFYKAFPTFLFFLKFFKFLTGWTS